MEPQALGLPLLLDTGEGVTISPISTLVVTKGMNNEGEIVYATALSEGMDIMDALALVNYGKIDIENRVRNLVEARPQEEE